MSLQAGASYHGQLLHVGQIVLTSAANDRVECCPHCLGLSGSMVPFQVDSTGTVGDRHLMEQLIIGKRVGLVCGRVKEEVLSG